MMVPETTGIYRSVSESLGKAKAFEIPRTNRVIAGWKSSAELAGAVTGQPCCAFMGVSFLSNVKELNWAFCHF